MRRHRRCRGRRRVQRGRGPAGPRRGAGRQRRHHRRHAAAADGRGVVHPCHRRQPDRRVPGCQAGDVRHAARPPRSDDLRIVGGGPARFARAGQLRGEQGRVDRAGAVHRPRAGRPQHHRQRHRARLHRDRYDRRAHRRPQGRDPGQRAATPVRQCRRDRRYPPCSSPRSRPPTSTEWCCRSTAASEWGYDRGPPRRQAAADHGRDHRPVDRVLGGPGGAGTGRAGRPDRVRADVARRARRQEAPAAGSGHRARRHLRRAAGRARRLGARTRRRSGRRAALDRVRAGVLPRWWLPRCTVD